jgi:hypothetical protein
MLQSMQRMVDTMSRGTPLKSSDTTTKVLNGWT